MKTPQVAAMAGMTPLGLKPRTAQLAHYANTPHKTIEEIVLIARQRVQQGENREDVADDLIVGYGFGHGSANAQLIRSALEPNFFEPKKETLRAQHTPGPWQKAYWTGTINGDAHQALAIWPANVEEPFRGEPICLVSDVETEDETDHANADLLAAAPELLEAASKLIQFGRDGGNTSWPAKGAQPFFNALMAAIGKAEGRQA